MSSAARALGATLLALALLLPFARGAGASCAAAFVDVLPDAEGILVGRVVERRPGFDLLEVEEVWSGPDLAPQVWVQTGPAPPPWPVADRAVTSVDAELRTGERYVVAVHDGFQTNSCLVGAPDSQVLALRPEDVRAPVAGGETGADLPLRPWVGPGAVVVTLLLVAAAAAVVRRRGAA